MEYSEKVQNLIKRVEDFLETHLFPIEIELNEQIENGEDRWQIPQQIEDLKALAKSEGLWNLFLPESDDGFGLTNLEYAPALCNVVEVTVDRFEQCKHLTRFPN